MVFRKSYQTHMIQMIKNNYWPFTCFHPIGYKHSVQSVGSLNLIEISFEEIRCDYYSIKNVCADPDLIHVSKTNFINIASFFCYHKQHI